MIEKPDTISEQNSEWERNSILIVWKSNMQRNTLWLSLHTTFYYWPPRRFEDIQLKYVLHKDSNRHIAIIDSQT